MVVWPHDKSVVHNYKKTKEGLVELGLERRQLIYVRSDDDEALTLGGDVYVVACGCGDRVFSHLGGRSHLPFSACALG